MPQRFERGGACRVGAHTRNACVSSGCLSKWFALGAAAGCSHLCHPHCKVILPGLQPASAGQQQAVHASRCMYVLGALMHMHALMHDDPGWMVDQPAAHAQWMVRR